MFLTCYEWQIGGSLNLQQVSYSRNLLTENENIAFIVTTVILVFNKHNAYIFRENHKSSIKLRLFITYRNTRIVLIFSAFNSWRLITFKANVNFRQIYQHTSQYQLYQLFIIIYLFSLVINLKISNFTVRKTA